jgi:hypothetical protein
MIDGAFLAPGEIEAHGDDHLRVQPAECGRQVTPQRHPVFHDPVLAMKELDLADADDRRAAPFFLHPQWPGLVRGHAGDACLTPGRQHVRYLFALAGPAGDG